MVFSGRTRRKRLGPPVGTEGLRTRAKTITDFGAHSPSPRPSPIGWERENRPPSVGVSNRSGSCERRGCLFPLPSDGRVRVRVVLFEIRLLSGACFCTNPKRIYAHDQ